MSEKSSEVNQGFLSKTTRKYKEGGLIFLILAGIKKIRSRISLFFWHKYYRLFKSWKTFTIQEKKYRYFYHEYNLTWNNERAVEIPIVWDLVKNCKGSVLEVGNVLSHYFNVGHDIVDKYEKARGVISQDVTDFFPPKKYDLIVSISTLEHVGWNENPYTQTLLKDGEKIIRAVDNLKRLLNGKGKLVVTFPFGYNPFLDDLLRTGKLAFDAQFYLKRVSKDNRWVETDWRALEKTQFNKPFPFANGLVIGICEN